MAKTYGVLEESMQKSTDNERIRVNMREICIPRKFGSEQSLTKTVVSIFHRPIFLVYQKSNGGQ